MGNDENMKKVRPLADDIYSKCKRDGLTLKEFRLLAQLLLGKASEIQAEKEKTMLSEVLQ